MGYSSRHALVVSLLLLAPALTAQPTPRRPRGIYAVVNIPENLRKLAPVSSVCPLTPPLAPADVESYFSGLYQDLVSNPAVSGLALWVDWCQLQPAANTYDWSWLDDAFNQVSAWNARNPSSAAKTIQLVPLPGFQTPQWVLDQIPSCDGLFQSPVQTPPAACGKATFVGFVEGGGTRCLPMPWNDVYQSAWRTFLTALAARYQSNPAFVSISVAGPTASSEEMILPANANTQSSGPSTPAGRCDAVNPPGQDNGLLPNAMWIKLLAFHYPGTGMALYQRTDQAFIDEWEKAIDMYGQVFSGVTLVATTGSGLPNLAVGGFTPPPAAFSVACPNPDMDCAAETTILAYLAKSTVGGANAKAAQEDGMEAGRPEGPFNLGVGGIKVVSQSTAHLAAPAAQVLGGAQFNSSFSNFPLQEGCTSKFPPNASDPQPGCSIPPTCTIDACIPVACIPQACLAPGVTQSDVAGFRTLNNVQTKAPQDLISPEQAAYNVLKIYFDGTPAAATFSGAPGSTPLNYLQIYAADFQYAEAHTGAPVPVATGSGSVSMSAQDLLNLAGAKVFEIGEPALPPSPSLSIRMTWQANAAGVNPKRGDMFTYSITVTNNGNATATGVNVLDSPDSRTELALAGTGSFNLGTLAAGATQTVTLQASASASGTYSNTAIVTWSDAGGNSAMASASTSTTVDPQPGDFAATVSASLALQTGVLKVAADGATVYVANNPGDRVTILTCAGGACSIGSTVALAVGSMPVALALADIDGDGVKDLLVLNQGAGTVTAVLSSNPAMPVTGSVGANPLALAPFRVGDGVPRIAVTFPGAIGIFAWDGQHFQPAGKPSAGQAPTAVVSGDFNGDGVDDLLVTNAPAATVQVWFGDGMGGFNLVSEMPAGAIPVALATGDFNNDGALDAAVLTTAGLSVLLNDGTGNLLLQPAIPMQGGGALVLADLNGDGNLDAAVANSGGSSVDLYRGDGSGALGAAGAYLTGRTPLSLAASDLIGNGNTDLIVGDLASQDVTVVLINKP